MFQIQAGGRPNDSIAEETFFSLNRYRAASVHHQQSITDTRSRAPSMTRTYQAAVVHNSDRYYVTRVRVLRTTNQIRTRVRASRILDSSHHALRLSRPATGPASENTNGDALCYATYRVCTNIPQCQPTTLDRPPALRVDFWWRFPSR